MQRVASAQCALEADEWVGMACKYSSRGAKQPTTHRELKPIRGVAATVRDMIPFKVKARWLHLAI
eukprot:scaffold292700_cov30-Tisochrysis_lutea.AAC.1